MPPNQCLPLPPFPRDVVESFSRWKAQVPQVGATSGTYADYFQTNVSVATMLYAGPCLLTHLEVAISKDTAVLSEGVWVLLYDVASVADAGGSVAADHSYGPIRAVNATTPADSVGGSLVFTPEELFTDGVGGNVAGLPFAKGIAITTSYRARLAGGLAEPPAIPYYAFARGLRAGA
jgi:hypothetical protein